MRQILKRQKQQELEIEGMWGGVGRRAEKPLSRVASISDKSALNWKHTRAVLRPLGPDSVISLIKEILEQEWLENIGVLSPG